MYYYALIWLIPSNGSAAFGGVSSFLGTQLTENALKALFFTKELLGNVELVIVLKVFCSLLVRLLKLDRVCLSIVLLTSSKKCIKWLVTIKMSRLNNCHTQYTPQKKSGELYSPYCLYVPENTHVFSTINVSFLRAFFSLIVPKTWRNVSN